MKFIEVTDSGVLKLKILLNTSHIRFVWEKKTGTLIELVESNKNSQLEVLETYEDLKEMLQCKN